MRTTSLDPDYRIDPKSDFYCCRCQKTLHGKKHRWAYLKDSFNVIHPDDTSPDKIEPEPIGLNCARIIGIDFTIPEKP